MSFCGCAQCFFWHLYFLCVYVLCCVLCFEEEEEEGEHANVLSLSREREHKRNNNTPLKFERHFDFEFFGWFSCFFSWKEETRKSSPHPHFCLAFFFVFLAWLCAAPVCFVLRCQVDVSRWPITGHYFCFSSTLSAENKRTTQKGKERSLYSLALFSFWNYFYIFSLLGWVGLVDYLSSPQRHQSPRIRLVHFAPPSSALATRTASCRRLNTHEKKQTTRQIPSEKEEGTHFV